MDEVINVGMNKINKTPEAVKATANSSLMVIKSQSMQVKSWHSYIPYMCNSSYPGSLLHYYLYVHKRNRES